MSNRKDAFKTLSSNPAKYFVEWKSDHKCFSYYDKESGKNTQIPLPFKFLALEEMHTIKGWNDASESGIYSNEVKYIGRMPIKVQSFKGGPIGEGLYKDIKMQVVSAGGVYHKSIYAMLEDGIIVNVALKGAAVREWGEFTQKTKQRLTDEWIVVDSAIEGKKGSITYSTPGFKFDSVISVEETDNADKAFDELESYLKDYSKKDEVETEKVSEEVLTQDVEDDDLTY